MPEISSIEATAAIRERETGAHVRIVAMTAHAMNGDRERSLNAGMDGYLAKPIDLNRIDATLEHEPEATESSGPLESPTRPAGPVDRDDLMMRLDNDEQLATELIQLFLAACPQQLVAIKAAVDDRDGERIRTTAHALKGMAGNLSATRLYDAAQTLERIGAEAHVDAAQTGWRELSAEAAKVIDVFRQFDGTRTSEPAACAS